MDNFDKCLEAENEIIRIEERLRSEDYSGEALDDEKNSMPRPGRNIRSCVRNVLQM